MRRNDRGFTVNETLVVVAICALLSAIIFAATAPVRERARQAQCTNNLRQIGVALQVYRQDWEGTDPIQNGLPLPYHRLGLPEGHMWVKALNLPRSTWFCPSRWCDPFYDPDMDRQLASSYMFLALSDSETERLNRDSDTYDAYRPLGEILSEDPSFPILVCVYHDRHTHAVGPRRLGFSREGRVLGLTLLGEVRWYNYADIQRKRHYPRPASGT